MVACAGGGAVAGVVLAWTSFKTGATLRLAHHTLPTAASLLIVPPQLEKAQRKLLRKISTSGMEESHASPGVICTLPAAAPTTRAERRVSKPYRPRPFKSQPLLRQTIALSRRRSTRHSRSRSSQSTAQTRTLPTTTPAVVRCKCVCMSLSFLKTRSTG